jgi:hypothetical protein
MEQRILTKAEKTLLWSLKQVADFYKGIVSSKRIGYQKNQIQ